MNRLFEKLGTQVSFAESGSECVRLTQNEKYDLIFLDHLMPDMDGIQTVKEIRKHKENLNSGTPIIALGTPDQPTDEDQFIREGFTNYIEKPVEYKMLRAALLLYLSDDKKNSITEEEIEDTAPKLGAELEWLTEVAEITPADGIKNCGSEEAYLSALEIFYNSIDDKANEIMAYYDNEDWVNYTIKVHALKSSARIIGASELSEMALELENAGNENNTELIRNNTEPLIALYRSFSEKLSWLSGEKEEEEDSDKPLADSYFLEDAYLSLIELSEQMEFDLVEMLLESVKEYRLEPPDKEAFDTINKKFMALDWHAMAETARQALSQKEQE